MTTPPDPREDQLRRRVKAELRKRMRGLRQAMPATSCAERSSRIVVALEAMPEIIAAKAVALFWPIVDRHEVDVRALDASLRARKLRVAYPAIDPETREMTFRWADASQLDERGLGFREPPPDAPEVRPNELSAIVVPALAIDPGGHRIGYGAGFYDRALCRFAPPATTLGVAFDFQLVAEVAITDGDVALDWIVTDARTMRADATLTPR